MAKILIFAGTTEGRILMEKLCENGHFVYSCVATKYAKDLVNSDKRENIHVGRLEEWQIEQAVKNGKFDIVVDATHPYAVVVSENVKKACENTGIRYLRLLRDETYKNISNDSGEIGKCVFVESIKEAVNFLNMTEGNVLLTTGSKELSKYKEVQDFSKRLYARVLPTPEILKGCNDLGFLGKHVISMQGPFTYEMNKAMLQWLDCRYMVTKDSGKEGGTIEKIKAARDAGATIVIIGRPTDEKGLSFNDVLVEIAKLQENIEGSALRGVKKVQDTAASLYSSFPLFMDVRGKKILIVGGGNVAERRIKVLLKFAGNLEVVAAKISDDIVELWKIGKIKARIKDFEKRDIEGKDIVIAATNNRSVNRQIGLLCKEKSIIVNVADSKEECDFYFPGIVTDGELIVGVTADGQNHSLAKQSTEVIRKTLVKMSNENNISTVDSMGIYER